MPFIYFDLGNVLLAFSQQRRIQQLANLAGVPEQTIVQALFEPAGDSLFVRLERGEVDPETCYNVFAGVAEKTPDYPQFHRAASDIFTPLMETIALAERLATAGHSVGVLSNTSVLDWQFAVMRFAFLQRLFDPHVLSFQVGAMKPSAAIFQHAIARAGVAAHEVFFVDDYAENVRAAAEAGIDAVQFTSASALADELRSRGIHGA